MEPTGGRPRGRAKGDWHRENVSIPAAKTWGMGCQIVKPKCGGRLLEAKKENPPINPNPKGLTGG
jgi:hypothetical protein